MQRATLRTHREAVQNVRSELNVQSWMILSGRTGVESAFFFGEERDAFFAESLSCFALCAVLTLVPC